MTTLTVLVIARDEASVIGQCLDSLWYTPVEGDVEYPRRPIWDELIVVDTGSSDDTCEIAKAKGAKIAFFPWVNDYAAARNFAESLATCDYIYWQDADEKLVSGHAEIRAIVEANEVASVRPVVACLNPETKTITDRPFPRQDLLHRKDSHTWMGKVHEWTEGPVGKIDSRILVEEIQRPEGDKPQSWDALREEAHARSDRGLFYLAAAHGAKQHYVEAIALIDYMLALPSHGNTLRSRAAWMKGHFLLVCGDKEGAVKAYLDAIKEYPALAEPYFYLGEMFMEHNNPQMALGYYQAACAMPQGEYAYDIDVYEERRFARLKDCQEMLGAEVHV